MSPRVREPTGGVSPGSGGTVFRFNGISASPLVTFANEGPNGSLPNSGLIAGTDGNFDATTVLGGTGTSPRGTVIRVTPAGGVTVLTTGDPELRGTFSGELLADANGDLYGVTNNGGRFNGGVVFKYKPGGNVSILYEFAFPANEATSPRGGLVVDAAGNLYGTTTECPAGPTVFKLTDTGFAVPEPTSLATIAVLGTLSLRRRRR